MILPMLLLFVAVLGLIYTWVLSAQIKRQPAGNKKMQEIAAHIREGAMAFLNRQYRMLAVFVLVVAVLLGVFLDWYTSIAFILGSAASALAGNIGMRVATHAGVRTTQAARTDIGKALRISFNGGSVMGIAVSSLALLGIVILFIAFDVQSNHENMRSLLGFAFGAGSIALFARVGGGIYTKAADVGADLVGKVEKGIPEDDPRNPAVIADNVGDNVGDVAGMGADLFESFVGIIISSMILGYAALQEPGMMYPLVLAGIGIVMSVISTFVVRTKDKEGITSALFRGLILSSVLVLVGALAASYWMFGALGPFWAAFIGLLAGVLIGVVTEYYTSAKYKPTRGIAEASSTGAATNIIEGFSVGMASTAIPTILVVIALGFSYWTAGLYGIALAGVGMLSTLGIQLAIDAFGPVADNAGGIAEMAGLPSKVRERTDALDSAGNTTAAIGKGFALGSAAMTVLSFMSAYNLEIVEMGGTATVQLSLMDPLVMIGLLIGAMIPFVFSSLTMRAVSVAAFEMITEVRRQFKEIKGLMQGKATADYARCVDIATKGSLKAMILPGLLVICTPIIVGLFLGIEALGGYLTGVLAAGMMLAMTMVNAGGAWDNAKKYIETGALGGKGSDAHKAAVVGDTFGDPNKDTSGPSLNILIKLTSIVALVFLPLFLAVGF